MLMEQDKLDFLPELEVTLLPSGGCIINEQLFLEDTPVAALVRGTLGRILLDILGDDSPSYIWNGPKIDNINNTAKFRARKPVKE